jgi:hypothetical protein
LTEQWTATAKYVFRFDVRRFAMASLLPKLVQASHPFLAFRRLEDSTGQIGRGRSLSVVVDATFLKGWQGRRGQAAYTAAAWLQRADRNASLGNYFNPPLTPEERKVAAIEEWILGVA